MKIYVSKLTAFCGTAAAFFSPLQRIVRARLPSAQMYTWRFPEGLFLFCFFSLEHYARRSRTTVVRRFACYRVSKLTDFIPCCYFYVSSL